MYPGSRRRSGSGDFFILAGDEITFAALGASEIMAAVPSEFRRACLSSNWCARADSSTMPGNFMAGNTRVLDSV